MSKAVELKCNHIVNPIAIANSNPVFSWILDPESGSREQKAYQIIVSKKSDGKTVWDSGKVMSDQNFEVQYKGKKLESGTTYNYKVRVWDENNKSDGFSDTAVFGTGIEQDEWKGCWIGAQIINHFGTSAPMLRNEFAVDGEIAEAKVFMSALGYGELYINGNRIGDSVLDPGWTNHYERVPYVAYDVTGNLIKGKNCIGVILGKGMSKNPGTSVYNYDPENTCLRLQMNITFKDGSKKEIFSNQNTWLGYMGGPVLSDDVYHGEIFDANLDIPGWSQAGFNTDEKLWRRALELEPPKGRLKAQDIEPVRIVRKFKPKSISKPSPGVYVIDAGQNLSGFLLLDIDLEKGLTLMMRYAENILPDGKINTKSNAAAKQTDYYTSKGGLQSWHPRFTYHGFRYVQIELLKDFHGTGLSERLEKDILDPKRIQVCPVRLEKDIPDLEKIQICLVRSDIKPTGNFSCANSLVNSIYQMAWWTEATNQHSVLTDCPQRDERQCWLNDMRTRLEGAMYYFDLACILRKTVQGIYDEQGKVTGAITDTAPRVLGYRPGDPLNNYVEIPLLLYKFYGEKRTMEEHYGGLKKWIDYLGRQAENYIIQYSYWGDWMPPKNEAFINGAPKNTPGEYISTGFYYYDALNLAKISRIMGKKKEAGDYEALAGKIREKINEKFLDRASGNYSSGNQACNAFALWMGFVPYEYEGKVARNLVDSIKQNDYHLATGSITTRMMLETLCEHGFTDIAYAIVTQDTYPGWGYMNSKGATTMWETWEGPEGSMGSENHPMNACVGGWLFKYLCGIRPVLDYPGFKKTLIKPFIPAKLDWAQTSMDTVSGKISVKWEKQLDDVIYTLSVPKNGCAEIALEGSRMFIKGKEAENTERKDGRIWKTLTSGEYTVIMTL